MTEFRDLSRLPVEQRYWDDLEARITADLSPLIRGTNRRAAWWTPLARRAWLLGGVAAAAVAATIWLLPARSPSGIETVGGMFRVPQQNPALVAFVAAPAPPAVAAVVLTPPEAVP